MAYKLVKAFSDEDWIAIELGLKQILKTFEVCIQAPYRANKMQKGFASKVDVLMEPGTAISFVFCIKDEDVKLTRSALIDSLALHFYERINEIKRALDKGITDAQKD